MSSSLLQAVYLGVIQKQVERKIPSQFTINTTLLEKEIVPLVPSNKIKFDLSKIFPI